MACKTPITINTKAGPIQVGCKQCLNCRIYRQSVLAMKCEFEHLVWQKGFFVTLTYKDAPEKGDYSDMDRYLRRLRDRERYHNPEQHMIRYLACGEYGSKSGRFHYHALIWNLTCPNPQDLLTELWQHGFAYIKPIQKGAIRYVSRYTLKFHAKGEEAVAGWSKHPPLGSLGARALARKMRRDGRYDIEKCFVGPMLQFEHGENVTQIGPLDSVLKREFMREYLQDESYIVPTMDLPLAHLEYRKNMLYGDPSQFQADVQEERARFYETARLANDKL